MKKFNRINLETMRNELSVLGRLNLESLKGGYINSGWGCLYNCLEYVNDQWCDGTKNADDYYNEAVSSLGNAYQERGLNMSEAERAFSSSSDVSLNERGSINNDGGWSQTIKALTEGGMGASIIQKTGSDKAPDGTPQNHYVVATGYDAQSDTISYVDPSAIGSDGKPTTGSLSKSDYYGTLGLAMDCDDDTGNIPVGETGSIPEDKEDKTKK